MGAKLETIILEEVLDYWGEEFELPKRDARGKAINKPGKDCLSCGRPQDIELFDTTSLLDILEELILFRIPRDTYTRLDGMRAGSTHRSIQEARKHDDGKLILTDADYKWLVETISEDAVGPRTFTVNFDNIEEAVGNTEKKKRPELVNDKGEPAPPDDKSITQIASIEGPE